MKSQAFNNIIRLLRLNVPTGNISIIKIIYLTFFPACWGFLLTSSCEYYFLVLFFLGSISTRGMGCIINDYFDKDFDAKVSRTKNRPLANGSVSLKFASLIFIVCAILSLLILLQLNKTCLYIGLLAALMIIIYPLMKRFTYFPQVFLGFTFNLGALIGYATVTDVVNLISLLLYLGCVFWTIGFDTIYGFMDAQEDKKIGIKSSAIYIEYNNYRFIIALLYIAFIALFMVSSLLSSVINNFHVLLFGCFLALSNLIWQVKTLNISNQANCLKRFNANNLVGVVLTLTLVLGR